MNLRKMLPVLGYVGVFLLGAVIGISLVLLGAFDTFRKGSSAAEWGSFPTTPKVELLDDGRDLRLLEDFVYIDPNKKIWIAPKNSVVDGASIPRVFWSITGGPLEGQYRNASIVHDTGCTRMTEAWESIHYMFYEACRCGGVAETKAKILYAAVYHFGPRWIIKTRQETRTVIGPGGQPVPQTVHVTTPERIQSAQDPSADVRDKLEKYIKEHNPSLEDLKRLDPKSL